ncbi:STAS domain-containing protein [Aliidiomarina halalkaliphila]|uniref:STAS domain-containing protein n=1 Tax=Aliidiomarina halalkaliphila TaxID=2593535 RepID=A0A552X5Y9_9GAMM|nr:STAS domain-containing protein [Aliidiomarina halalkaliphila]TRW50435.1 STAS domain-containing protein [Aliidiomarina halalkaliphila]
MSALQLTREDTLVRVAGDLDRDQVGAAWSNRSHWMGQENELVMDLSEVEKVDSAGLAFLIQIQAELAQQQRALSLHNVNTQLRQFAAVSGVTDLLSLSYTPSK